MPSRTLTLVSRAFSAPLPSGLSSPPNDNHLFTLPLFSCLSSPTWCLESGTSSSSASIGEDSRLDSFGGWMLGSARVCVISPVRSGRTLTKGRKKKARSFEATSTTRDRCNGILWAMVKYVLSNAVSSMPVFCSDSWTILRWGYRTFFSTAGHQSRTVYTTQTVRRTRCELFQLPALVQLAHAHVHKAIIRGIHIHTVSLTLNSSRFFHC